jgi:hypothetical protein
VAGCEEHFGAAQPVHTAGTVQLLLMDFLEPQCPITGVAHQSRSSVIPDGATTVNSDTGDTMLRGLPRVTRTPV